MGFLQAVVVEDTYLGVCFHKLSVKGKHAPWSKHAASVSRLFQAAHVHVIRSSSDPLLASNKLGASHRQVANLCRAEVESQESLRHVVFVTKNLWELASGAPRTA